MIVRVGPNGVALEAVDDFTGFHVETALDRAQLRDALRAYGAGDLREDGAALISTSFVVGATEDRSSSPLWAAGWTAMLEYAGARGWITDDGSAVQAHVVFAPTP